MPLAVLCRRFFIETEIETFNVEVVMVHLVFSGSCGFFGGGGGGSESSLPRRGS